jgi:hypothetical protein
MFRQLILAALLVVIVGVALFYAISGSLYIVLACSAALLSVLFVRTGDGRKGPRGSVASVKRFPTSPEAVPPPAPTFGIGRARAGR